MGFETDPKMFVRLAFFQKTIIGQSIGCVHRETGLVRLDPEHSTAFAFLYDDMIFAFGVKQEIVIIPVPDSYVLLRCRIDASGYFSTLAKVERCASDIFTFTGREQVFVNRQKPTAVHRSIMILNSSFHVAE